MHMFDAATAGNILAKNLGQLEQISEDQPQANAGNGIARLAIAFALVALLAVGLDWAAGPPAAAGSAAAHAGAYPAVPTCID